MDNIDNRRQSVLDLWVDTGKATYAGDAVYFIKVPSEYYYGGSPQLTIINKNGLKEIKGYTTINDLLFGDSNFFEAIFGYDYSMFNITSNDLGNVTNLHNYEYHKIKTLLEKDKLGYLSKYLGFNCTRGPKKRS